MALVAFTEVVNPFVLYPAGPSVIVLIPNSRALSVAFVSPSRSIQPVLVSIMPASKHRFRVWWRNV